MLKGKVVTYNDMHLSINPMYLNVTVSFVTECLQHCFILKNLFQLLIVSFLAYLKVTFINGYNI